ncbi:MAG: ribonuclease III [Steroidobacteraceae bacterium]
MIAADWPLSWLQSQLNITPRDVAIYEQALTHRSASADNNERLEYLGDAVLSFLVAEELFAMHPHLDEGDLSRMRARLVSGAELAPVAAAIGIGEQLRLGSGEAANGGHRRESILADALEALIGAVYLDRGIDVARCVTLRLLRERLDVLPDPDALKDAKTRLQEYLQSRGMPLPEYRLQATHGEPHEQVFHVCCAVRGLTDAGHGSGSSRRKAEQEAAQQVLDSLLEQQ